MIIFDLDKTLFYTKLIVEDLKSVFNDLGISGERLEVTFKKTYDITTVAPGCYSIYKHLTILPELNELQKELAIKNLQSLMNARGASYLYKDVLPLLSEFKKIGHELILVSAGDPKFQELKAEVTGIKKFFTQEYYVENDKISILSKMVSGVIININDSTKEILEVENKIPLIHNVFMNRYNKIKPKGMKSYEAKDMKEALEYIRSLV